MTTDRRRVAVLGAGIMGCCTALLLARRGCTVTLIDKSAAAMSGASRWNEGKIHLGYLYAADPSGRTADKVIPGGLAFAALMEALIGESIAPAVTGESDLYLVHPNSVVDAEAMARYFVMLDQRLSGQTGYFAPLAKVEPLSRAELAAIADNIGAGFRVPERSVNTQWIADRLIAAVKTQTRIHLVTGTVVSNVTPQGDSWEGPWRVVCQPALDDRFDVVVNALWEGRGLIDACVGAEPDAEWSHRYRLALFVRTSRQVHVPNAVLATGPFGDIKNYDGRNFYLSWYPAGLMASGTDLAPPYLPSYAAETVQAETAAGLGEFLPCVADIIDAASEIKVAGGWVFARGSGALHDANASLHRRDQFGALRRGTYYSVDTGKYSTAPWLAKQIVEEIAGAR